MSNQYAIKITEYARKQIKDIYNYIYYVLQSPDIAKRWMNIVEGEIRGLSFMPERLKLVDEEPWHSEDIRKLIIKNYYVYFWIDSTKDEVWVIAVVYSKRNQQEQLKQAL